MPAPALEARHRRGARLAAAFLAAIIPSEAHAGLSSCSCTVQSTNSMRYNCTATETLPYRDVRVGFRRSGTSNPWNYSDLANRCGHQRRGPLQL